ncbi:MAG: PKD domain-containing protein [Lentimicrobium sp.]
MKKHILSLIAVLSLCLSSMAQTEQNPLDQYITGRTTDETGREIISIKVPGKPPANYRAPIANYTRNAVVLGSVPAFSWSFGCSATAAAMAAGFYDNNGYANVYTGPTNGGLMPMNNSSWGSVVINGETRDLCPLSATMLNLDGRTTRGHVDDYWEYYGSAGPDPYITNGWPEHTHADCTGDFMGTNQSDVGSSDGSTTFFYYGDGSPIYDYSGSEPDARDGCHGMRLFYESRGYSVVQNYTQLIYGQGGNTLGFTFNQYMNEINNGRPVLIQVAGHTMLGYGYDDATQLVYLHDTWDYQDHSMVWGGEYAGMAQWGVTVVELFSLYAPPVANFSATSTSILTGESVIFTDLSAGNPTGWQWSFEGGTPSVSSIQQPVISYNTAGVYTVTLIASNANGSDTEIKTGYILVEDPVANFSGNPTNILTGENVSFTDLSSGNPISWLWTFQGGTPATSILQNPIITYNSPGNYTVTLIATNAYGSYTETKTGYILVEDPDYCDASATCDEYIASLNFNTISNTSSCGTNGYTDFTGISTTLTPGTSYPISITTSPWYVGDQCGAWIDWNQDLDFEDEGEYFPMSEATLSGIITPPANAFNGPTRLRVRILWTGEIVPCGHVDWGETEDYTVIVDNPQTVKTLDLTVFLEGLFDPATQTMRKANDEFGEHFAGSIADQITVGLAQPDAPHTMATVIENVDLNQDGSCEISLPASISGSYYIVISHRNSITSWSTSPVSFAGNNIVYNFTDQASKTFGSNVKLINGRYCFFGGDVNQDGTLDTGDMTPVDNDASNYLTGYLPTDVNGDGVIDTGDMTIVDNNAGNYISEIRP